MEPAAPSPSTPPPPEPIRLVAAGDIACRPELVETASACRRARTALVEGLAPDAVAPLGDIQYEHGELANFNARLRANLGALPRDYASGGRQPRVRGRSERDDAPGYFSYFDAAAGEPSKGYYRWELGGWTVFALNSGAINWTRDTGGNPSLPDDCWPVSCAAGSAQEQWLRAELAALPDEACVIAYWHHPLQLGLRRSQPTASGAGPLLSALYEHGAELVPNAHSHNYERLEPVSPKAPRTLAE